MSVVLYRNISFLLSSIQSLLVRMSRSSHCLSRKIAVLFLSLSLQLNNKKYFIIRLLRWFA